MRTTNPPALTAPLAELLEHYDACPEARAWAKDYPAATAAWEACVNPQWMLWALDALGLMDDRVNRKFACWCARYTPLADGRTTWDLLTDPRSRTPVEVAERFADGQATDQELAAAWDAARDAAWAAGAAARDAAWAAGAAARDAAWAAAWASARAAAWDAARSAAWAAAWATARATARDAAWDAQCKAIRQFWGNPFSGKSGRKKKQGKGE